MTDTVVTRCSAFTRRLLPAGAAFLLMLLATTASAGEAELVIPISPRCRSSECRGPRS